MLLEFSLACLADALNCQRCFDGLHGCETLDGDGRCCSGGWSRRCCGRSSQALKDCINVISWVCTNASALPKLSSATSATNAHCAVRSHDADAD
jgi:hypothetical protein